MQPKIVYGDRADRPIRVGEHVTFAPALDDMNQRVVIVRSRHDPQEFVVIETMKGMHVALRLLAICERTHRKGER